MSVEAFLAVAPPKLAGWLRTHADLVARVLASVEAKAVAASEDKPENAVWTSAHGFPFPSPLLKPQMSVASRGGRGPVQYSTHPGNEHRDAAKIRWIRNHQDELGEQLLRAANLSDPPTVAEVEAAVRRSQADLVGKASTVTEGVDGLVILDPVGGLWFELRMREWQRMMSPVTYEPFAGTTGDVLRFVTEHGTRPFRLATIWRAENVSVGSGGYTRRDVFVQSPPIAPPEELKPAALRRKETKREEKDELISLLRKKGWVHDSGGAWGANEYLTAPGDQVRIQIKERVARLQIRDQGRGWTEGTALGPVAKLAVDKIPAWADRIVAKYPPPRELVIKPARAKEILEKAGERYAYTDDVIEARKGYTAGFHGDAREVPDPQGYMSDHAKTSWLAGYDAAVADKSQTSSPLSQVASNELSSGQVMVRHSATEGTTVRGETRGLADKLKAAGLRWWLNGKLWYIPKSRELAETPYPGGLPALAAALGLDVIMPSRTE